MPNIYTKIFTVPVARWKTGSRSSNWDCSPIAPAVPPSDRTSSATLRANQLRLYFSSFAYVLLHGLRRLGLTGTAFAKAQSTTIRLKLLKIGARLRLTARKVWLSFSEAYPYASDIAQILANLKQHPAWLPPG